MAAREEVKNGYFGQGTRLVVTVSLALAAVLFFLPLLVIGGTPLREENDAEGGENEATLPIDRAITTSAARDKGRAVRLKTDDGQVVELTMADYLWGVVAAEMPASFEEEAL